MPYFYLNFSISPKRFIALWLGYLVLYKFGWIGWKLGEEQIFKNCKIRNFAKCTRWPQTKLKESGIKRNLHMCTIVPRVPNYHPFHSTISRFRDIRHLGFPIDSHVIILKCHKFCEAWPIAEKSNSLYSPMVNNVLIQFGWEPAKSVIEVAFWNFQLDPCGPVLRKISMCHNFCNFWQIAKNVIAYISPWLWYFIWSSLEFRWKLLKE